MKYLLLLTLGSLCLMACAQSSVSELMNPHRWKHRVVITFAPQADYALLEAQQAVRRDFGDGWQDRDLFFIHLTPRGGETQAGQDISAELAQAMYERYAVDSGRFVSLLVGKDGGEKLRKTGKIIPKEELFAVIDAMPMRRREMREQDPDHR